MSASKSVGTSRVHLALFLTMIVWGVNLSAVKGLTESLDILLVAAVRMIMASMVLALMSWRWGRTLAHWKVRDWVLLVVAAFFLVYCQQIAFAAGLARTTATNAALVMALGPAISLSLEAFAFRRPISRRQGIGIVLALSGVAAVILHRPNAALTSAAWGDFWILCSVFGFALGGLCIQRLTMNGSPLSVSLAVHCAGAAMLSLHVTLAGESPINDVLNMTPWQWSLASFSAVLATGVGSVIWSRGISSIGVGRTSTYISWVPIFGVCFGALFFSEPLTVWHALGLVAVIFGTVMTAR